MTTPTVTTASSTAVRGEMCRPAMTAIAAAMAPSVEAIGVTTPTLPRRNATYSMPSPTTFVRPAISKRPTLCSESWLASLTAAAGTTSTSPIVITQASVEAAPILRLAADAPSAEIAQQIDAARPPRTAFTCGLRRDAPPTARVRQRARARKHSPARLPVLRFQAPFTREVTEQRPTSLAWPGRLVPAALLSDFIAGNQPNCCCRTAR
jgi:hypothetical protein